MRELNHILCPVDLSSVSKSALAHAFAWAHWYGAELHVLHVAPIPVAVPGMPGVVVTLDQGFAGPHAPRGPALRQRGVPQRCAV